MRAATCAAAAVEDGVSEVDVDSALAGHKQHESASDYVREMILVTLRESGGQMESDRLDAAVAVEAGVAAKTVKNLRSELRGKGWLRSIPDKDEHGEIRRWYVALTNAAPDPGLAGDATVGIWTI